MTAPLGMIDKALSLTAWTVCAGLFLTVGWTALQPDDPLGAVSLWSQQHGLMAWVQTAVLGGAVAAVGTLLIGRRLPDAGIFAAALGLAAVNLRGSHAGSLLIGYPHAQGGSPAALSGILVLETLGWFAVIVGAALVSGTIYRWCFQRQEPSSSDEAADSTPPDAGHAMILSEIRAPMASSDSSSAAARPGWVQGIKQLAVTLAVAMVVLRLLSVGAVPRALSHGQVYFTVATAFYVGVIAGVYQFPTPSALWGCLAVPLLACIGYLVVWIGSGGAAGQAQASHIPASMFLRALPLTYISVGTAAVMAAFWFTLRWPRTAPSTSQSSRRRH